MVSRENRVFTGGPPEGSLYYRFYNVGEDSLSPSLSERRRRFYDVRVNGRPTSLARLGN